MKMVLFFAKMGTMNFLNPLKVGVLLLGGHGSRFGCDLPKQYVLFGERPLFAYAAEALEKSAIDFIVYVVPEGYVAQTESLLERCGFRKQHAIVVGGNCREESAFSALRYLAENNLNPESLILLQDGDRPNLSLSLIEEHFQMAEKYGAAVTAIPASDSIAISEDGSRIKRYLPRKTVYQLQTPQTFRFSSLFECFLRSQNHLKDYTDEGSLYVSVTGKAPKIVLGDKANLKITERADAASFMEKK